MQALIRPMLVLAVIVLAAVMLVAPQASTHVSSAGPTNRVLARALDIEMGRVAKPQYQQLISSGVMYSLLQASGEIDKRVASVGGALGPQTFSNPATEGCQNIFTGGASGIPNIRVNQDCSFRRQAEEVIVVNPTNPNNLIAGQNDSRIGFNHCAYDWSFNAGQTWGDQIPPFYQFILADGHTADACSDPTATFDSAGNAYIAGVLFDINSPASGLVVMKSLRPYGGSFYHTPASVSFQAYSDSPAGVVANDNNANIIHDKEFIVADSNPSSPKKNNVYATWTRFNLATGAGVGVNSPIYFSQSTNGGAAWSAGVEISGANSHICTASSGEANAAACDQDQGSHPVVGPDGTVYVAFGNGNTPTAGVNQHLIVTCPPTRNCALAASWTQPQLITQDIGTQPVGPNATTGCPAGRQCLPPNGYRLDDFTQGSLAVDSSGKLYFTWADFRNGAANCKGNAATATPPCDNDVFYAFSLNRGVTWSAPFNVTPKSRFGANAQWMPWSAVTPNGATLFIGYYDRSYGNCETTGCNDITLARIQNPAVTTAARTATYQRITTASMPNLVVANNPVEAGFLGDYMWVTVDRTGKPYVIWADTRGRFGTVEEDIYMAKP